MQATEKKYLDSKSLGRFLKERLDPNIREQYRVLDTKRRFRVDYYSEKYKFIVEFDGPDHYKTDARVISDKERAEALMDAGYRVIRVPYFVQMTEQVIGLLFGDLITDRQPFKEFRQGFIATQHLPAYFSPQGVELFLRDLDRFAPIRADILSSLEENVKRKGDWRLVYPDSLRHLFQHADTAPASPNRAEGRSRPFTNPPR